MGKGEESLIPRLWVHPAHPYFKWFFLFFLCFLTFGSYWCYDIPAAIEASLIKALEINNTQFALFYSVYNFMNIGVVLVGGYFLDRIGLKIGAVLFCFFIALGQIIFSVGSSIMSTPHTAYAVMLVGRIVFSIGGESLSVAQSTFCSKWFKGKDLALSFGITLSFARIGSFANLATTPKLAQISIPTAVWFGTITCAISLAMTVMASWSDHVRDRYVKSDEISAATPFNIRDVLHFPASLWLIYFICVFYYIGVFTLISISGQAFLITMFHVDESNTGIILGIPYAMSVVLSPFMGVLVGKVGKKPVMLFLCSLIMGAAYGILLWCPNVEVATPFHFKMPLPPLLCMILIGFSYSLCAASLWPCVPLLVQEHMVGTAYGIMNSIQNAGLALASVIVGLLSCKEHVPHCVRPPIYLLMGVGLFTATCSILLIFQDYTHGKRLFVTSQVTETEVTDSNIITKTDETTPLIVNNTT